MPDPAAGPPCARVYVRRFSCWAPGMEDSRMWMEWAEGKRDIPDSGEAPALEFTEARFRRRLSQISRMTIQVLHDLGAAGTEDKIMFLSFRGEIGQQFKINEMLIKENAIMPAAFSHSVFNTPVALAAIALNLRAGYAALYPGEEDFSSGFRAALAPLLSGKSGEIIFVYADESLPGEYRALRPGKTEALAFAACISAETPGIPISVSGVGGLPYMESPADFLKHLLAHGL